MLSLYPLFLILLSFFTPSSSVSVSETDDAEYYSNCSSMMYPCAGNLHDIRFPFRSPQSPDYCGHPVIVLKCSQDNTTLLIQFDEKDYQVKDIDYAHYLIHLTDYSLVSQGACPKTFTNTSIDFSLFDYSWDDMNLTVLFNCSPAVNLSFPHSITCAAGSNNEHHSFYALPYDPLPHVWEDCGSVAFVPVNKTVVDTMMTNGMDEFLGIVEGGFSLKWKVGDGWCDKCIASHGICGSDPYSQNSSAPACFCPKGTSVNTTCVDLGKSRSSSMKNLEIVIGSVVGAGFLLVFLSLALYFHKRRKVSMSIIFLKKNINNNQRKIEAFLVEYGSLAPKRYRYSDVKKITKAFREKLGQGGYGTVFKGTLSNGKVVAVKILDDSKDDGEDFINEVASIGRTSHVNVVNLLGFCFEGSKRALIYEYMCNGSLEKLIYSEKPKTILDWEKLYQIALGIARGLEYLHRGCNTRMVHFDIKPHNILLDQDFCPKISDFGLAKLCLKKDNLISIAGARGTIGYIAPEVFSRNFGIVSSKSDVYSYGMMVLEIAGGKKNMHVGVENSSETYFPHWIYEYLDQNGDLLAYGVAADSEETVRKMIIVGLWCIQTMPQNRPPMSRVIEMLEGSINDLQVPPKPYLSSSPLGSLIGTSSIQDICWDDSSSLVHS